MLKTNFGVIAKIGLFKPISNDFERFENEKAAAPKPRAEGSNPSAPAKKG